MDKIIIEGQNSLSGSVPISGAKNAVLPIMAAALMGKGRATITRVPDLRDTRTMIRLMEIIGAVCEYKNGTLTVGGSIVDNPEAPYELVKTMRASFYVLGPLLARFGEVRVSLPGGCAWGPRPVDFHLKGLEKLGAKITLENGYIIARSKRLQGAEIQFEFPSVGATGNIVMAAATAAGTTIIRNAAREPEIVQLCDYLNQMGSNISGQGTTTLIIKGVESLESADIAVIPDRIETGTFLTAGALLGEITLKDVYPHHLDSVLMKLKEAGCTIRTTADTITISPADSIQAVDITTAVYPGFPTDLQAQLMVLLCKSKKLSIISEEIFENRFMHVAELNRMGAKIITKGNKAIIEGNTNFKSAELMATDLRASV